MPPYLAGRQREQEYFQDCVEKLIARERINQNMIVYGPRGNGKTTLLTYLQNETLQKEGSKLDILWETPDEMRTLAELSDCLIAGKPKIRDWFKSVAVSVSAGLVSGKTEIGNPHREPTIRKLLQERCQKKPLVLVIDEAHTLQPEIGKTLLNISQIVRKEGSPFLLILAGTPNLEVTLRKADASFWDRSRIFPLDRLSHEEARQAIAVPLEKAGMLFAPGTVAEIAECAHCYPFFLQIWGDCLARMLDQTGETEITMNTIKEVETEAIASYDKMYRIRRNEIKKLRLLPVAESIADAFLQSGSPTLHESTLEESIKKGMANDNEPVTNERVMEKAEQLSHLGYIWQLEGSDYEPGIPSLMSYVRKYS